MMSKSWGAGFVGRRKAAVDLSVADLLENVPARSLIKELSIPIVVIRDNGDAFVVNDAFADLIGVALTELADVKCEELFVDAAAGQEVLSFLSVRAEDVVPLRHRDGHLIYAKMTRPVFVRRDKSTAVVAFIDVTELRWLGGRSL